MTANSGLCIWKGPTIGPDSPGLPVWCSCVLDMCFIPFTCFRLEARLKISGLSLKAMMSELALRVMVVVYQVSWGRDWKVGGGDHTFHLFTAAVNRLSSPATPSQYPARVISSLHLSPHCVGSDLFPSLCPITSLVSIIHWMCHLPPQINFLLARWLWRPGDSTRFAEPYVTALAACVVWLFLSVQRPAVDSEIQGQKV